MMSKRKNVPATTEGREIADHWVGVCDVAVLKEIDILAAEELLDTGRPVGPPYTYPFSETRDREAMS